MLRWPSSYRYLTWLNVPPTQAERSRVETHLGGLRLLLAALALVAFSIDRRCLSGASTACPRRNHRTRTSRTGTP